MKENEGQNNTLNGVEKMGKIVCDSILKVQNDMFLKYIEYVRNNYPEIHKKCINEIVELKEIEGYKCIPKN